MSPHDKRAPRRSAAAGDDSAVTVARVLVCTLDASGAIRSVGPASAAITGLVPRAWRDRWQSLVREEDAAGVADAWAAFVGGRRELAIEYAISHATTGETRVLRSDGIYERDVHGVVSGLVVVTSDVTSERERERAARRRAEEFDVVVATAPVALWSTRADGTSEWITDQWWYEITGLSPDSWLGDGWRAAVHPDDLARVEAAWQACIERAEPYREQYRVIHAATGAIRWVDDRAGPVVDAAGAVERVVGITLDVTDQVTSSAERELLARELEELAASVPAALWSYTAGGERRAMSERWIAISGQDVAAWQVQGASVLMDDDEADRYLPTWRAFLADGADFSDSYRIHHAVTGDERTLFEVGRAIRDKAGRVLGFAGATLDVTERAAAERDARRSRVERDAIAARCRSRSGRSPASSASSSRAGAGRRSPARRRRSPTATAGSTSSTSTTAASSRRRTAGCSPVPSTRYAIPIASATP